MKAALRDAARRDETVLMCFESSCAKRQL